VLIYIVRYKLFYLGGVDYSTPYYLNRGLNMETIISLGLMTFALVGFVLIAYFED
jgi:hypothetical protein